MTALLSASSDSQDKIEKYRENCLKMGIDVEPPDINRSREDFTPDDQKILFGLSAVKNLGQNAIENILEARKKAKDKFISLADFCTHVDLRVVNRRALETLIYCGAFDGVQPNRRQLIEDLDLIISWAQNKAKEQAIGQMNLFDVMGTNSLEKDNNISFDDLPSNPQVEDYSIQEKLKLEKEHLGFYVSAHPLKAIQEAAQVLSPINLNELAGQSSRKKISAVVILTSVKQITTRNGDPMAFIQMEDISGNAEGVIFPKTYDKIKEFISEDQRLIIWGKVDKKDDKLQLIVDDVELVEKLNLVILELSIQQALDASKYSNLKVIIEEQSGDKHKAKVPIIAIIQEENQRQLIRFGKDFWVQDAEAAAEALKNAGFAARTQPLVREVTSSPTCANT